MSYISRLSRFIPELKNIKPEQLKFLEEQFSKIINKFESEFEQVSEKLKQINNQYKDSLKENFENFMNKNFSQEGLSNESRKKIIEGFEKFYDTVSQGTVKEIKNIGINKVGKEELDVIYGTENKIKKNNNTYKKIEKENILEENNEKLQNKQTKNTTNNKFKPIKIEGQKKFKGSEFINKESPINYMKKYNTDIKLDVNKLKEAGFPQKSRGDIQR